MISESGVSTSQNGTTAVTRSGSEDEGLWFTSLRQTLVFSGHYTIIKIFQLSIDIPPTWSSSATPSSFPKPSAAHKSIETFASDVVGGVELSLDAVRRPVKGEMS